MSILAPLTFLVVENVPRLSDELGKLLKTDIMQIVWSDELHVPWVVHNQVLVVQHPFSTITSPSGQLHPRAVPLITGFAFHHRQTNTNVMMNYVARQLSNANAQKHPKLLISKIISN